MPRHNRHAGFDPGERSRQSRAEGFSNGWGYLAGGIALHLLGSLQEPQFMQAFARKGRFKDLMERIPVRVITARAALVGAASFGLETCKRESGVAA